ncbi:MAG TPA: VOC family protein [Spirochaetia bacterium]|nr:VOC family protein [Spirochaetia bacterium]
MSLAMDSPEWFLSGIQQIGVGVPDVMEAFAWFRTSFGTDVPIFDDAGEAPFMTRYTGNAVHSRHAILAANLHGGGAFEIWQFTSRAPSPMPAAPALGDFGIFSPRLKAPDVGAAFDALRAAGVEILGKVATDPAGRGQFFVRDPQGLSYQVVEGQDWLSKGGTTGGVAGAMIGVSDVDRSRRLYSDILGYDEVIYDESGRFDDLSPLSGGEGRFRRVLLGHSAVRVGAFSRLLGQSRIELVQALDRSPRKLFEGRFWGDIGFIQICFDIYGMDRLHAVCEGAGYPVTVDSADAFDMGEASGRFCYIEDPDGTLIEFVETHRIPILKKIGWYLNLEKRNPRRPLPNWMVGALGLGRVRD